MSGSNFPFIKNDILRKNLDDAFQHILILIPLSESATYDETAKSVLRKTIVIYTGSIVEALLYYLLDTQLKESDLQNNTWEVVNERVLYSVSDFHKIIAGEKKQKIEHIKKEKLNLGQINTVLKDKQIISRALFQKIDSLREMRNAQHIGAHTEVKIFTNRELEYAFSVASDVKKRVSELIESTRP